MFRKFIELFGLGNSKVSKYMTLTNLYLFRFSTFKFINFYKNLHFDENTFVVSVVIKKIYSTRGIKINVFVQTLLLKDTEY